MAKELDRGSRRALVLAAIGVGLPFVVILLKPEHYGLVHPATPSSVVENVSLRASQLLFWLLLPVNATAAVGAIWLQLSRKRIHLSLTIAAVFCSTLVVLWLWLMLSDFG